MPESSSQLKTAESPLFKELRESIAKETLAFTFACGGTIPISTQNETPALTDSGVLSSISCPPVDLRWDPRDAAVSARQTKLTFPLEPATQTNLAQLIQDMQPATFGMGGQDVYDESYRKATKLDPTGFSSTFNPYELGIVDTIAQALLPTLRHSKQTRAVKAELYKLNAYSRPSGKFKAHVDTPRSPAQFGSLVVCLPLSHQGGALQVRHNNKTVTFDWSAAEDSQPSVSWAAFYSDCEHEVLEVTQGHRLTLTYNLYCVRGNGQLGGNCPMLDPAQLPLYKTIFDLLHEEDIWREGGHLGYHCNHVYPHTNGDRLNFLAPDNLKGADMLMYEIFRSMHLKVSCRPTVSELNYTSCKTGTPPPAVGKALDFQMWGIMEDFYDETFDDWTGKLSLGRSVETGRPVGVKLEHYIDFETVDWLNDAGHLEPQASYIAYGNQHWPDMYYSSLALIAEIPAGGTKNANGEEEEDLATEMERLGVRPE